MNSIRFKRFAAYLALACLILTGSILAGTTTTEVTYAREVGEADAIYTLPVNTFTRTLNVLRSSSQDFIVRISLDNNAEFATGTLPAGGDLTLTIAAGGAVTISIVDGGTNGDTFVSYFVDVTTDAPIRRAVVKLLIAIGVQKPHSIPKHPDLLVILSLARVF